MTLSNKIAILAVVVGVLAQSHKDHAAGYGVDQGHGDIKGRQERSIQMQDERAVVSFSRSPDHLEEGNGEQNVELALREVLSTSDGEIPGDDDKTYNKTQFDAVTSTLDRVFAVVSFTGIARSELSWELLLVGAPVSVFLISHLMALGLSHDFALDKPEKPYKHLHNLRFASSVQQVSNEALFAFNTADKNMQAIFLLMRGIPDDVENILHIIQGLSGKALNLTLQPHIKSIKETVDKALQKARETSDAFTAVLYVLSELQLAVTSTKGTSEIMLRELNASRIRTQLELDAQKQEQEAFALRLNLTRQRLDTQEAEFKEAMAAIPSSWAIVGMQFVGGLSKLVESAFNWGKSATAGGALMSMLNSNAGGVAANLATFAHGAHKQLIQRRESGKGDEDFQKFVKIVSAKFDKDVEQSKGSGLDNRLKSLAKELKNLADKPEEMNVTLARLSELADSASEAQAEGANSNGEPVMPQVDSLVPPEPESGKYSLGHNERTRAEVARKHFEYLRDQEQKAFEDLVAAQKQTAQLIANLSTIDLTTANYEKILDTINDALIQMSELKKYWQKLVQFFNFLLEYIDINITRSVKKITEMAETIALINDTTGAVLRVSKKPLYENAQMLVVCAEVCVSISEDYVNVSKTYVLEQLAAMGNILGQPKEKAGAIIAKAGALANATQTAIMERSTAEKEKLLKRLEKQEKSISENIYGLLGPPTAQEIEQANKTLPTPPEKTSKLHSGRD